MTATGRRRSPAALPLAAVALAIGLSAVAGCAAPAPPAGHSAGPAALPTAFAWFTAAPAPAGWKTAALSDGTGVLSYPPDAVPLQTDPGTATVGTRDTGGRIALYLNTTPRQGTESLASWTHSRLAHLLEDTAATATLSAAATGLAFRGGTGSCVIDDYVTKIGAHHYREMACLVAGDHGSSVLVAAAPAADWTRYRDVLERAVDAYTAR
ncbi:hypothetical protein [Specibacter cremeus]|uniref:hypothetical protein n=1 Tax=Specibacter cremeus TaxID=1629051 RepID=UPI000F7AB355|nr:hypothetical protein [Specibacter cremeus]